MAPAQSSLAGADKAPAPVVRKGSIPLGLLAEMWEDDRRIRDRLRDNEGRMVKWTSSETTNKPTMANIAMNSVALTYLARWWCSRQRTPKSPSVVDLKREAPMAKEIDFVNILFNCIRQARRPSSGGPKGS